MPRKKSVSGRARVSTAENQLQLQAEKITKRLRSLEKAGEYGKLNAQKELIRFAQTNPFVSIKKSRGSKRRRLIVSKLKKTIAEQRLIRKKFTTFLKSKVSSVAGIRQARLKMEESLGETLSGQIDEKATQEDIDRFIDIAEYAEKASAESILDKMTASAFNTLVHEAIKESKSLPQWFNILNDYVLINNDYMRQEAEELYYKYVA